MRATRAKAAAAAKSTPRDHVDERVLSAIGSCCLPDCLVLSRAMDALKQNNTVDSSLPSGHVAMQCTNESCTHDRMHSFCFAKLEKQLQALCCQSSSKRFGLAPEAQDVWGTKVQAPPRTHVAALCPSGLFAP